MFQRRNDSKRLCYAYQSVWVAVNEEPPSQSLRAKSEDPFAVAATAGELDRRSRKISAVCLTFLRQNASILC